MRNRLYPENQTQDCQEIEELRRICCEETDRARQARIDELSMHQERNPTTVSQLLTQIQELQFKVNSMSDAREFYDLESGSSSGGTHVPSQLSSILSPWSMPRRDSGLPHDTRNIWSTSGNVFERLPAQEGRTSTICDDSKNLASSLKLGPDTEGNTWRPEIERDENRKSSSIPVPRFQRGAVFDHTGGTHFHSGVIDDP